VLENNHSSLVKGFRTLPVWYEPGYTVWCLSL